MIENSFTEENLCILSEIMNYWANASYDLPIKSPEFSNRDEMNSIIESINSILEERRFFEEWGVYKKDIKTEFSSKELNYLKKYLQKTLEFFDKSDPDMLAIFDREGLIDLQNKLLGSTLSN